MSRPPRAPRPLALALALLLATPLGGWATAQPRRLLDRAATEALVKRYRAARHWGSKAIVLTALGARWDPIGAAIVADALVSVDPRLRAFGLEALRTLEREALPRTADRAVVAGLFAALDDRRALMRTRARDLLRQIAPFVDAQDEASLRRWWAEVGPSYRPPGAPRPVGPRPSGSVDTAWRQQRLALARRAAVLDAAGLEIVLCLDSTASMQPAVDSTRVAVGRLVGVLRGIAPALRLGLVHFKDTKAMEQGAEILVPLTAKLGRVEAALLRLKVKGGGDREESVEQGLFVSLQKAMGWQRDSVKLVLVIGDAPPRAERVETLLNTAAQAHEGPWASWADTSRPFVISAIHVGTAPDAARVFAQMAARGGGVYENVRRVPPAGARTESPLVRLLLRLSFGPRWAPQLDQFLATYREYGF